MKLTIAGAGSVTLRKSDFVGSGGQASVYARGAVAYKVYTDPDHAIPADRIQALSALTDPRILRPERLLLRRKTPAGYTMRYLPDATPLCATFPRAYRDRHGLTAADALARMVALAELVRTVHAAGVLIVDLNPMNVLIKDDQPHLIDVDSWQTAGYPATAIQDGIRDRHAPPGVFSEGTDWFSFAVVCFQALVGIHPFKGRHPSVKGLDARMKAGISALDPAVRLPGVCYPLDHIPPAWRQWMTDVFHHHRRTPPPAATAARPHPAPLHVATTSTRLVLTERLRSPAPIAAAAVVGGRTVVLSGGQVLIDRRPAGSAPAGAVIAACETHPVLAWIAGGRLTLRDLDADAPIAIELIGDQLAAPDGRLVVKSQDAVLAVRLIRMGSRILAATTPLASVLPQATRLLDGLIVQDMLGAAWVTALTASGTHPLRVPALDGVEVLAGRLAHRTAALLVSCAGRYDTIRLHFSADFSAASVERSEDVPPQEPQLVSLGGMVVQLQEDGGLRLQRGSATRVIQDDAIGADCRLFTDGGLMLARGGILYGARMRS